MTHVCGFYVGFLLNISYKFEAAMVEDDVLQLWFCECLVEWYCFQCPPNN